MTQDALLDERATAVLRWRCRRGLVENDIFLERFFQHYGPRLTKSQAEALNTLMDLSDNDLLDLFLRRTEPIKATPAITQLLEHIRNAPHNDSSPK